ncbi:YjiH family protein [Isachenkonia alkalipeptolytica]|uniref:YjiH family protein n=1 Tax=Isachenkonia alkalipeptolytica TaxID=2565777 RepID=A0AA44BCR8_9CLOT|nr:YjiH family protein [Isachenkonia alkalipeptolytica]NBG87178.1 YjiH family protein [Isachenkonia alkalipeptolytica]
MAKNTEGPQSNVIFERKSLLKFALPSLIGLILFVIPLPYDGNFTIGVGRMADLFRESFGDMLPALMVAVVSLSALLSLIVAAAKPKLVMHHPFLKNLLAVGPLWLISRVLGAFFILMTFYEIGPGFVTSGATGGTILYELLPTLATWFFFAGFLLPLLLDFGAMDYLGTLIRKLMRPLFRVPGRSAIDGIASWIGSGPVGVVLTDKQYQKRFYTAQEASIISVCFSIVSLPFAVVVAQFLELQHVFLQFYFTISFASFIAALILPRIPPLTKKSEDYYDGGEKNINEEVPDDRSLHNYAVEKGILRAKDANGATGVIVDGTKTVIDIYLSLMPLVMAWGTLSLIIVEHTPIFTWISYPLIPLLNLLQVPGAEVAAPAVVVGFADMFLPAILVSNLEYEITRFIIGAMSFTQLVYLSETGAVILKSKIPMNLLDLFIVFLQRTIITLPIVVLIAHWIY